MQVKVGERFFVPIDGKMIESEIISIRPPAAEITSWLVSARFVGSPDLLPSVEVAEADWQGLNQAGLEARYRQILSGGFQNDREKVATGAS